MTDDAFEHAAKAQPVLEAIPQRHAFGNRRSLLATLFRFRGETAESLWSVLKELFPQEAEANLPRLRRLMNGQATRQELSALIEKASALPREQEPILNPAGWIALAEAGWTCRQEDLARQCLEKADGAKALLLQGDLLACARKWDRAAQLYFQAWEKDPDPLALYLSGKALIRTGQKKEGNRRIELARLLPLGNGPVRQALALGLAARGDQKGALREFHLLFRLSSPGSALARAAVSRIAIYSQLRSPWRRQTTTSGRS